MTEAKQKYAKEIKTILGAYNTGDIHYIEWGTVVSFSAAVVAMGDDWDCDWVYNEDEDYYDFKAFRYDDPDADAEARLRLVGE
jgi:hypothetical protein